MLLTPLLVVLAFAVTKQNSSDRNVYLSFPVADTARDVSRSLPLTPWFERIPGPLRVRRPQLLAPVVLALTLKLLSGRRRPRIARTPEQHKLRSSRLPRKISSLILPVAVLADSVLVPLAPLRLELRFV